MVSVNKLLKEVLEAALADPDNGILAADDATPIGPVVMVTSLPPDSVTYDYLAYVRHIAGSEFGHDRDYASITADCYGPDELVAGNIAEFVRDTLRGAQRRQTVYPSGYISTYDCPVSPFPFPRTDGVTAQERSTAEYRLLIKALA